MAGKNLFGRTTEKQLLMEYYRSKNSSLLAIVGRRRIGKTYLVRRALEGKIDFEFVGTQDGTMKEQLQNFRNALLNNAPTPNNFPVPKNWIEAFQQLKEYLILKKGKRKKVIFLDEFPWINTPKSGFVEKFAHFWNSWASENNVMIVVCGSAATWMMKNIVNGRGGLHNRISQTIYLKPFTLSQTKDMLKGMGMKTTNGQLLELYMVFGGVPYYLSLLNKNKSVQQNIDELIFNKFGRLHSEYQNLLPSLFEQAKNHLLVMNVLASKWKGMTRSEITANYKKNDGGGLTKILIDLEQSGFICSYVPFRKSKKDTLFRISDAYSLFYLKFLLKNKNDSFFEIAKTQNYRIWCGYAFENICLQHVSEIQQALGIAKIKTMTSSYLFKGSQDENGFQIDLLIERADNVINVCEMKYHTTTFIIDKKYYTHIKNYLAKFQEICGDKYVTNYTVISVNGFAKNQYYNELVDSELVLKQFFE